MPEGTKVGAIRHQIRKKDNNYCLVFFYVLLSQSRWRDLNPYVDNQLNCILLKYLFSRIRVNFTKQLS